uniref:Galactose mutarotase n=1 Tax=Acrobeloides nanus TaxID=290746 RepID=A0A914EB55_9BILA
MSITVIEYGATLISVQVPNGQNETEELIIGFNNLTGYLNPHEPYFGATIGRYANRIANATFSLNGTTYNLTGVIHGGARGFDKHLWNSTQIGDRTIEFHLFSPDGDQGFPGNVHTITTFSLTDDNEIQFTYDASSDKTTPISLTNHGYWNLAGAGSGNIYGHQVQILADIIVVVDKSLIPTGELKPVTGTPYDLKEIQKLGAAMNKTLNAIPSLAFDNAWQFESSNATHRNLTQVVKMVEPKSGRSLEISTTQPCIQFYTGNGLTNKTIMSNGRHTERQGAFAFEPQSLPDAPNHKNFPSPFINPGDEYHQVQAQIQVQD